MPRLPSGLFKRPGRRGFYWGGAQGCHEGVGMIRESNIQMLTLNEIKEWEASIRSGVWPGPEMIASILLTARMLYEDGE